MRRNRTMAQIEFDTRTDSQYKAELTESKRRLLPEVTDENPASVMERVKDYAVRFIGRHLRSWMNWLTNQMFISTASDYDAITQHARRAGYVPEQEQPARATIQLTLRRALTQGLILRKVDLRFQTKRVTEDEESISYEMVEDQVIIPAGSPVGYAVTFDVIQGSTVNNESLGTSDGEQFQEYETSQGYAIEGSEKIEVQESIDSEDTWVEWIRTDNLLLADPADRVYEVLGYTEDGHMIIAFGSGDGDESGHGMIPPNEAPIRITYRTLPGNQNGNVPAGSITKVSPSTSTYNVTNPAAATGWAAREAIETTRWTAQRHHRIEQRCVKPEDYVDKAERNISGVGRVYVVPGEFGENTLGVHVLDEDGAAATVAKCQEVAEYLDDLNPGDEHVVGLRGLFNTLDLTAKIWPESGYDATDLIEDVEDALEAHFDPLGYDAAGNRSIEPGQSIYPNHVLKIIQAVAGVDRAQIVSPTTATTVESNKLPALGTVTITEGE